MWANVTWCSGFSICSLWSTPGDCETHWMDFWTIPNPASPSLSVNLVRYGALVIWGKTSSFKRQTVGNGDHVDFLCFHNKAIRFRACGCIQCGMYCQLHKYWLFPNSITRVDVPVMSSGGGNSDEIPEVLCAVCSLVPNSPLHQPLPVRSLDNCALELQLPVGNRKGLSLKEHLLEGCSCSVFVFLVSLFGIHSTRPTVLTMFS